MSVTFPLFESEIRAHSVGGYHRLLRRYTASELAAATAATGSEIAPSYLDFLQRVGAGKYFGGALVIYCLADAAGFDSASFGAQMAPDAQARLHCFGGDGTTEGCFCLDKRTASDTVYWYSWEDSAVKSLGVSFVDWIEAQPRELFSKKIFAGYKQIKDFAAIQQVQEERSAFCFRLLSFDKTLVRPPTRPNDFLPRYNLVRVEVMKERDSALRSFTFKARRSGSRIGDANVEYATIDISDCMTGVPAVKEAYVFDPFNLPFEAIIADFSPAIDLNSPQRVRYAEIASFL